MGAGYIAAMAAPHTAAIQRQAKIAQAAADQAAAEAVQASARQQAEFARSTTVLQAEYKAQIDKAQAQAAQAGPLAQAEAQQAVISAQADLAAHQAELRQKQLVAEVIRPAEAEAEKVKILARADAERTRIAAEAAASNDRVALDQMLITQLPLIVKEAASGLSGANVNILNGADGLGEIAAGLVSQGLTILDSVRKGVIQQPEGDPNANGSPGPTASSPCLRPSQTQNGQARYPPGAGRPVSRIRLHDRSAVRAAAGESAGSMPWISSTRCTTRGAATGIAAM